MFFDNGKMAERKRRLKDKKYQYVYVQRLTKLLKLSIYSIMDLAKPTRGVI
jgi:hypothetical protein